MAARKAFAITLWVVTAIILAACVYFSWLLRDGLGPDAVDSHGANAFRRFAVDMVEVSPVYLVPLILGFVVYPWRRRRST